MPATAGPPNILLLMLDSLDGRLLDGRLARGLGEELHLVELLWRRARAREGLDACCTTLLPCYTQFASKSVRSVACARSRGLAALRLLQSCNASCRLPQPKFRLQRPPHASGCRTLEKLLQGSEGDSAHDLRGSTALELSTASTGD